MDKQDEYVHPYDDPQDPLYRPPVEYGADGIHTSRPVPALKGTPKVRRTARNAHKWTDAERRWIALAMFEANNNIELAIQKLEEYRAEYGPKKVCPLPSVKQMTGLTRGRGFDTYLENIVEESITGRLMLLSKSKDERVAQTASAYLMDRAKGKATARVQVESVSVTIHEQSKKALEIIKRRDEPEKWTNPDGETEP